MREQWRGGRLEGKVVIVTGAGTSGPGVGTGRAMAVVFAREGASVLLVDKSAENAAKTQAAIAEEGGEASAFQADVSREDDCRAMVEAAIERYGALHVLVNNVGIRGSGTVLDVEEAYWDNVLAVNLKSVMLGAKYAVPRMTEAGGGSIINVSSVNGIREGDSRTLPYTAAKGAMVAMTRSMAVHHGRAGIRTNCIAPGHIYTPMVSELLSPERRELRRKAGPLGTEGTAWDIAFAALFLAGDEARWISGVVLPVDGGLLAATPLAMYPYLQEED